MPLEYEDLREAWGDAQRHAGAKVSKRPLECPMWWAWACETGSAPGVEPEVALACRDLVTARWSKQPAPLSPEAAEVVFHVAVCGRAHR